jgi:hypothetical protein
VTRIQTIVERIREMGQLYSRLGPTLSGVWPNAHVIYEAAEHVSKVLSALEASYTKEMEDAFDEAYSDADRLKLIAHDLNTMQVQLATCLDLVRQAADAAESMPKDKETIDKLKAMGWKPPRSWGSKP